MSNFVLATKLYIPPTRADAVARPRLIETVLGGVSRPGCLVLVSGPAGSGKSTLLSQFAAAAQQPVAWVSLDDKDNDPGRFWAYVVSACRTRSHAIGGPALEQIRNHESFSGDAVPSILINELQSPDEQLILVLDDYHAIQNDEIHAGLAFLIEHVPPNLHIVVATRSDPPWPLPRYRARDLLVEIRAPELRFSPRESGDFLRRTMALDLSADDAAVLTERTEGWVAGLQLAALSIRGRMDKVSFIRAFTGGHVYVADYLVDEVLHQQSPAVQRFLLQTSILDRLNGELCDAVTGGKGGSATLAALQKANVFLVPLDDEGRWYRYHGLFAALLRSRLPEAFPPGAIPAMHVAAADWLSVNGMEMEAIPHAVAASDFERVAGVVERVAPSLMAAGRYRDLQNGLASLPGSVLEAHPPLAIYQSLIGMLQAKIDMSEDVLLALEARLDALPRTPANESLRLEAVVFLCHFLAFRDPARAGRLARQALAEVPPTDLKRRAHLAIALYAAHGMEGEAAKAEAAYLEGFRLALAAGFHSLASQATMVRALDLVQYGKLTEAAGYCRSVIELGSQHGEEFFPAGHGYIGLAAILLERFELENAELALSSGLDLCRRGALDGLYTGRILLARLLQARGELGQALCELQGLEQSLQRREFTHLVRAVSIRLSMGDIEGARQFVPILASSLKSEAPARLPQIVREAFQALLIRILLAEGKREPARRLLDDLQAAAWAGQRFGRLIEVYLLRAQVLRVQATAGDLQEAARWVEMALELGLPEGFVLVFIEEGPWLLPVLEAIANRQASPARLRQYAQTVLAASRNRGVPAGSGQLLNAAEMVEPITARELEVLRLLACGDSNQTIAKKLVITVRTVKKHTGNIYGKLNVSSRTQAAARARELGLIPQP